MDQQEQESLRAVNEITGAAPPVLAGVVTAFGAEPVDFPLFVIGKAIEMQVMCGPLTCRLRIDPGFAETVCEQVMEAARKCRSGITPASMTDVAALDKAAKGRG